MTYPNILDRNVNRTTHDLLVSRPQFPPNELILSKSTTQPDTILSRKEYDGFWIWTLKRHDTNKSEKNAE